LGNQSQESQGLAKRKKKYITVKLIFTGSTED